MSYLQEIHQRQVRVLFDFEGDDSNKLHVVAGDIVTVYQEEGGWMEGQTKDGRLGWFPSSFAESI